jgi:hypothetical protein
MKDLTEGKLDEALKYAETIKDDSLQKCLKRLDYDGVEAEVMTDFAPLSFYFVRYDKDRKFRGNGGIIFHGKHDNGGDGGAPTFSVCLTPCNGWQIHT